MLPPPLGQVMAIVGQPSGSSQADSIGRIGRIAFTRGLGLGKGEADERKGFIRRRGLLAYPPKLGR